MDLKIIGGKIVTAKQIYKADIGISRGIISHIQTKLNQPAKETIDASGMLVFPGIIDAHVHLSLPAGGTITNEDFESGTKAAACGGVTTIIDFAAQEKGKTLADAIRARRAEADGKVAIDYALHVVPTDWNRRTANEMARLIGSGFPSFKMYMIYAKAGLQSDDAAIFSALEQTARYGGIVTVHAESAAVLDLLIERFHNKTAMKKYGSYCHALSRPNFIEAEAISRAVTWAEATGGRLYIVHMSTKEGVEIVRQAKARGVNVYAETCPHYLLFDDSIYKKPNGHLYAMAPQVKKQADQKALWRALAEGVISTVATDNCTFTRKQKNRWRGDFTKIPCGLPGVETLLPLIYSYGVARKRISLFKMVELLTENPAKLFGLFPRKGAISLGSDADLVIFDPKKVVTISQKSLQTDCDWSPYEGMKVTGYPTMTLCRGKIVAKGGRFIGQAGYGKLLKRGRPGYI
jgi:dihydropyrimidinase